MGTQSQVSDKSEEILNTGKCGFSLCVILLPIVTVQTNWKAEEFKCLSNACLKPQQKIN